MSKIKANIFIGYALTTFGSLLSTFVGFDQIFKFYDSSVLALAFSLSYKTFFVAIVVALSKKIVSKFGLTKTVVVTQGIGMLGNFCLIFAIRNSDKTAAWAAIGLSSIPGIFLVNALTETFKFLSTNETQFRKLQSARGMLSGLMFLTAGLVFPLIANSVPVDAIVAFDLVTYVVAAALFAGFLKEFTTTGPVNVSCVKTNIPIIHYWKSLISLIISYCLVAIPPMISASQSSHRVFLRVDSRWAHYFWALEAAAFMISNFIYHFSVKKLPQVSFAALGSIVLLVALYAEVNMFLSILAILTLRILIEIEMVRARDTFVFKGANFDEVHSRTTVASVIVNLTMALSPFLIAALFANPVYATVILILLIPSQTMAYKSYIRTLN